MSVLPEEETALPCHIQRPNMLFILSSSSGKLIFLPTFHHSIFKKCGEIDRKLVNKLPTFPAQLVTPTSHTTLVCKAPDEAHGFRFAKDILKISISGGFLKWGYHGLPILIIHVHSMFHRPSSYWGSPIKTPYIIKGLGCNILGKTDIEEGVHQRNCQPETWHCKMCAKAAGKLGG